MMVCRLNAFASLELEHRSPFNLWDIRTFSSQCCLDDIRMSSKSVSCSVGWELEVDAIDSTAFLAEWKDEPP